MRSSTVYIIYVALATAACVLVNDAHSDALSPLPKEIQELRRLAPAYANYKLSSRPVPDGIEIVSLSVSGEVIGILREVKGDVKGAFFRSGGNSYIRSYPTKEEKETILKTVTQGLLSRFRPDLKIREGSAWRVLVGYRGSGPGSHVFSYNGGPLTPQDTYDHQTFLLNTETSELLYHKETSCTAPSTDKAIDCAIKQIADRIREVLKVKKSAKRQPKGQ